MYSFNEPRYFFIANHQPLVIIFVVFCIGLPYKNFTRIHESSICNINHIYFIAQINKLLIKVTQKAANVEAFVPPCIVEWVFVDV